jgi:hypothetical protein
MAYKIIHELADAAVSISWTMCPATSMTGLFGNLTLPVTSVYFLSSLFLHLSYVILTACLLFPQCLCFARFFRLKNSSLDGGKEEKEAVEG